MAALRYESPNSIDDAVTLIGSSGANGKIFAGGTDVLVLLHSELIDPEVLIDVKEIPELMAISEEEGIWTVGAALPGMKIIDNQQFNKAWPGVCEGVALIGSVQVKGRATIAGNLCNASPAADSVPAIIAAGAIANIVGPNGLRKEAVENIVVAPGKTSLANGELITSFEFPKMPPNSGDCYLRLTPRTEMDIAVVGAGVNLTLDDAGICTAARVAIGAVAPTALLVQAASDALIGTKLEEKALNGMVEAVRSACDPISDKRGTKEYRIKTAGVIARRAALKALERARES